MNRLVDDLPPTASDEELVEWGRRLLYGSQRPNRPLVAQRNHMSTEELLADIAERAASVHARGRVSVRQ